MDIYATSNLNDFVNVFATAVLGALDSSPQKAMRKISTLFQRLRPTLTMDELTGMPKFSVSVAYDQTQSTLKEIFDYLKNSNKKCCIAIDEFQQIKYYPEKGVEALLRFYIQFLPDTRFIFAGSKKHMMSKMFLSANEPFYQSTQILTLAPINEDAYYDFAEKFIEDSKRKLSKEAFNFLYDRYDGVTGFIHTVLNRMYDYKEKEFGVESVKKAILEVISERADYYSDYLRTFTAGSASLLKAIAREDIVKAPTSGDFIKKYNLKGASSVSAALKSLLEDDVVYDTDDGYIIYDYFFGEWLRMNFS